MWNIKTKVISVTTRETETSLKLFRIYLSNIPEEYDIRELQKAAIHCTALHTYSASSTSRNHRRTVNLHALGNWCVSGTYL
jgi:hypothetical protein